MPSPGSPRLSRHGVERLKRWQAIGIAKDESLAADADVDRSAISHYRSGERTAPLGLIDCCYLRCSPEELADALRDDAMRYGQGRVRVELDDQPRRLAGILEEAADVNEALGLLLTACRRGAPAAEIAELARKLDREVGDVGAAALRVQ